MHFTFYVTLTSTEEATALQEQEESEAPEDREYFQVLRIEVLVVRAAARRYYFHRCSDLYPHSVLSEMALDVCKEIIGRTVDRECLQVSLQDVQEEAESRYPG